MHALEELVWEKEHGEIGLYAEFLEQYVSVVELLRVLADEMHRNNISFCLYAFSYERLGPWHILDDSVYLAGALTCREYYHLVIRLVCF